MLGRESLTARRRGRRGRTQGGKGEQEEACPVSQFVSQGKDGVAAGRAP